MIGRLSDRFGAATFSALGLAMATIVRIAFALALHHIDATLPTMGYLLFMSIAAALFVVPNNKMVLAIFPHDVRGIVTATLNTVYNLNLALGIVILELETVLDEALPVNATVGKNIASIPRGWLVAWFRYAYFGAAVSALSGAAVAWSRRRREIPSPAVPAFAYRWHGLVHRLVHIAMHTADALHCGT